MHKIYIQNKPLFLIDKVGPAITGYLNRPTTVFLNDLTASGVKTMIQQLKMDRFDAGVYLFPDLSELLRAFKVELTVIVAAGGMVYTPTKEVLLIFRKGKWDLPKGKLDEGESLEVCALREIKEETGADLLSIEKPLYISYHTYYEKSKHILKESHWYLIKATSKSVLAPQTEEDIEECRWVNSGDVACYYDTMHASIIDVVEAGLEILSKKL